jgi:integrase
MFSLYIPGGDTNLKYLRREKTGLFSYYRGVPLDLRSQYGGKRFIVQSTKTHDPAIAGRLAQTFALRDDERWEAMRSLLSAGLSPDETQRGAGKLLTMWSASRGTAHKGGFRDEGKAFEDYMARKYRPPASEASYDDWGNTTALRMTPAERLAVDLMDEDPAVRVYRLSDARDEYLKTRQDKRQIWYTNSVIAFAIKIIGDLQLRDIHRAEGKTIRDAYLVTGIKTASVQRSLSILSAVFNVAKLEFELEIKNPFSSLEIQDLHDDAKDVTAFTEAELGILVPAILSAGDSDLRSATIIGIQLETGLRQAEALYLRTDDLFLNEPIPYVHIRAHKELNRPIKNKNSERRVPLVGISLVAAQRALAANTGTGWLFNHVEGPLPRLVDNRRTLKWLRSIVPGDKGTHSFRYAVEIRLTLANIPQGIIDAVTGHTSKTKSRIASGYFGGWPLDRLQEALLKIALPIPEVL